MNKKAQVAETITWVFAFIMIFVIITITTVIAIFMAPKATETLSSEDLAEKCVSLCFEKDFYGYCCEMRNTIHIESGPAGTPLPGSVDVSCWDESEYHRIIGSWYFGLHKYCQLSCENIECVLKFK